jgi:hypothetical protein
MFRTIGFAALTAATLLASAHGASALVSLNGGGPNGLSQQGYSTQGHSTQGTGEQGVATHGAIATGVSVIRIEMPPRAE